MSFQTLTKFGVAPLVNNQVNFAAIPGLIVDGTKNPNYVLEYTIVRIGYTGGPIVVKGSLVGRYQDSYSSWFTSNTFNLSTTVTVTLYQQKGGQIMYRTTNLGGSPTLDQISWSLKLL
jgi:hypothetical protein